MGPVGDFLESMETYNLYHLYQTVFFQGKKPPWRVENTQLRSWFMALLKEMVTLLELASLSDETGKQTKNQAAPY